MEQKCKHGTSTKPIRGPFGQEIPNICKQCVDDDAFAQQERELAEKPIVFMRPGPRIHRHKRDH
jgi:hypothetical protein